MNLNKTLLAAVIAFGSVSMAHAADKDQGGGKFTFKGSIIDAPCSIAGEKEQDVYLGQISNVALKDGGKSTPKPFSIKLENCSFGDPAANNKVSVTFTGLESSANNGLLGIAGSAQGASVAITDAAGTVIKLGEATKEQVLNAKENTLNFMAYLQGDGASTTIVEGDFQAVTEFRLAYN